MDGSLSGLAEAKAKLYFFDLVALVRDLHRAYLAVAHSFSSLLLEYDSVVPRSRLRLYPRYTPRSREPRSLYWGRLFTLRDAGQRHSAVLKRKAIAHLAGPFRVEWAFTIAKRSDLVDRFLDFDRRRLAMNGACRAVSRTFRWLEKAVVRKFPPSAGLIRADRREVPELLEEMVPRDLPPSLRMVLRSGWVVAFTLGVAEVDLCQLAAEVAGNPSVRGLRIELAERALDRFLRPAVWVDEASGKFFPKLTDRLMRRLRVKEAVRPVLSLKERKRRKIAASQAIAAGTLDLVSERVSQVQLEATTSLAQSGVILLPTAKSPEPPRAAV